MNADKVIEIFNEKKVVHFKLFSLEYTIENVEDGVLVYADLYPKRKLKYNDINEALNNFTIYNEPIIDNQNRMENIN